MCVLLYYVLWLFYRSIHFSLEMKSKAVNRDSADINVWLQYMAMMFQRFIDFEDLERLNMCEEWKIGHILALNEKI